MYRKFLILWWAIKVIGAVFGGGILTVLALFIEEAVPVALLWVVGVSGGLLVGLILHFLWPRFPPASESKQKARRAAILWWRTTVRDKKTREDWEKFRSDYAYAAMRRYLSKESRATAIPEQKRREPFAIRNRILDELSDLEDAWGLI